MYGRDRQTNGRTHRHRMTAQAALAQRRAAKKDCVRGIVQLHEASRCLSATAELLDAEC